MSAEHRRVFAGGPPPERGRRRARGADFSPFGQRQGRVVLHLAQREARLDVHDARDLEDDVVQEAVIGADVRHVDLEHEVGIARDRVALDDLGLVLDGALELEQRVAVVHLKVDVEKHALADAHLVGVEDGGVAADHPFLLKLADAAPAGARREADPLGQLLVRKPAFVLQHIENATLDLVVVGRAHRKLLSLMPARAECSAAASGNGRRHSKHIPLHRG